MAISDFVPTIWSARFLRHLDANQVWMGLCDTSWSTEVVSSGDVIKIPKFTKAVTIGDYHASNAISTAEAATGDVVSLNIDQEKYFNIGVDDVLAAQSQPNILDQFQNRAAIGMAEVIEGYLEDIFAANLPAGNNVTIAGNNGNLTRAKLWAGINDVTIKMDEDNVPSDGRWIVLPVFFKGKLQQYITETNAIAPVGAEVARQGFFGKIFGMDVYWTTLIDETTVASKNYIQAYAGQGTNQVAYAGQIETIEAYRPEGRFQDSVRGLYVYGGVVTEASTIYGMRVEKT